MDRILPVAVALIALLGPVLLPAAQAGYVEPNSFRFVRMQEKQAAFAADFHPNETDPGARALIVGGRYSQTDGTRFLATYDGHDWQYLFNDDSRSGPWVDVGWKPDDAAYALLLGAGDRYRGSIVACFSPCTSQDHLQPIWEYTQYYRHCRQEGSSCGFVGRQMAWHPSGDYTLLAGGGLLRMNETFRITPIDKGEGTFFNALDWHPSGNWSLIQKDLNGLAVCDDPCNTTLDLTDHSAEICYGMYPDQEDCVDPTGKQSRVNDTDPNGNDTYPGSKSIQDISFGPHGEKVYVSGVIHQRSRIMEVTLHGSKDPADWTWRYLEPKGSDHNETKYGEITSVDFHPEKPERMLIGSTLDRQVMTWNTSTDTFDTLLSLPQPKMQDTVWHPSGAYAIFPSRNGFYRYDPYGMPRAVITSPSEGGLHATGPIDLSGEAYPKEDGMNISHIETRVDRGQWSKIGEGNWTRTENGTVHWNATLDPTSAGAGHHVVYARAMDPVIVGAPYGLQTCVGISDDDVADEDQLPSVHVEDWNSTAGTVTVAWTNLTREHGYLQSEVEYTVARYPAGSPTDRTTYDVAVGSNITVDQSTDQGKMIYQVKPATCGATPLPYSGQASINLSDPPERPEPDQASGSGDGDGTQGDSGTQGDDDTEVDAGGAPDQPTNPYKDTQDTESESGNSRDGSASAQTEAEGSPIPGAQLPAALAAAAVALLARRRRDGRD